MRILETRNLTRRFGSLTAVDGIDISIEEGEIFGLLVLVFVSGILVYIASRAYPHVVT